MGITQIKPKKLQSNEKIKQLDDINIITLKQQLLQRDTQLQQIKIEIDKLSQDSKNKQPFIFYDGGTYCGQWKNKQRNGFGQFYIENSYYYIGEWKENKKSGYGALFYTDKEYYYGQFLDDKFHGKGTYVLENLDTYIGDWENNQQNGEGEEIGQNNTWKYKGQMKNGQRHGKGILINKDFEQEGEFQENDFINGVLKYLNKEAKELSYEGQMKDGMFQGKGILRWKDGSYYDGEFKDQKRHGLGQFHQHQKNDLIEIVKPGQWKDDVFVG